ncbi:MAG: hypothetical protein J0651_05590, partial [Actinobacteria bacterium]|nr:hypothetical protein [Actinomycetota bacterium]
MIGNGQCEESCYSAECQWDGWDCGCAAGCRYAELSQCKPECLVIDCGYGALEGYAPCTDLPARMEHKFSSVLMFAIKGVFPTRKYSLCPSEYFPDVFSSCVEALHGNIDCVYSFGMCDAPTSSCTRVSEQGCMECAAGLVNSASVCQPQCNSGLLPHYLVSDICVPADFTSDEPSVLYIDSDYQGSDRDGSRAKPFNSLNEGYVHSSQFNVKLLLSGSQHTLGQLGAILLLPSPAYVWERELNDRVFSLKI